MSRESARRVLTVTTFNGKKQKYVLGNGFQYVSARPLTWATFTNSVHNTKKAHFSIKKINLLMMFKEKSLFTVRIKINRQI
jgi:hypothetical protein